jgi:hypothetical protein
MNLVGEDRKFAEEQVVILFQVLSAEINFGYKVGPPPTHPPTHTGSDPTLVGHEQAC